MAAEVYILEDIVLNVNKDIYENVRSQYWLSHTPDAAKKQNSENI